MAKTMATSNPGKSVAKKASGSPIPKGKSNGFPGKTVSKKAKGAVEKVSRIDRLAANSGQRNSKTTKGSRVAGVTYSGSNGDRG